MFDDSLDVLTFPTVSDRGRQVPDYSATPTSVTITGVDAQPGASTELIALQREGVEIRYSVYVPLGVIPSGVLLSARSIVRLRGEMCQVNGQPQQWTGALGFLLLALTEWSK